MKIKHYFSNRENTLLPNINKNDVLIGNDQKILRYHDLKRAVILGTTYNLESSIEYVDNSGRNRVKIAKVIGLSEQNAILQNDQVIPVKTISKVVL